MNKFHFIFDHNQKAKRFKKILSKKFRNYSPKNCSHIIILGGDGFMLKTLKKNKKSKKLFYGVN